MTTNLVNPDQEKQLLMLKDLTRRMGVLHEAQVLQLKMWPMTLFTHAKKTEERVNLESKEIDYDILQTKGKKPSDLKERFEALNEWTKWLLGDDWVVRVRERGKLLYRNGRTVK